MNGEPSSTEKYLAIDYNNGAYNSLQGKKSLGDCLLLFYGAYSYGVQPSFCINPYRFICERELVE